MSVVYRLERLPVPLRDLVLGNRRRGNVSVGARCLVKGSSLEGEVTLGDGCKVLFARLKGRVSLDRYSSIFGPGSDAYSLVHPIRIGSFCSIARGVKLQEYSHDVSAPTTYLIRANVFDRPKAVEQVSDGPIEIGSDVWIGADSIVLSGVRIGHGAVVAANSVVNRDVAPYAIVGGSPARVLRMRFEADTVRHLLGLEWWDRPIEELCLNEPFFDISGTRGGERAMRDWVWREV